MAVLKSGIVVVGPQENPLVIPPSFTATWDHGQDKRALSIQVIDDQGAVLAAPDVGIAQTTENSLSISNLSGSLINATLLVTWQIGTIGAAGIVEGDDSSINITGGADAQ